MENQTEFKKPELILQFRELKRWILKEDELRQEAIESGYLQAKRRGFLDALDAAREGNAIRLWEHVFALAKDVCRAKSVIWEKEAVALAEHEMLDMGYFPPHWPLEKRERFANEEAKKLKTEVENWKLPLNGK